MADAPQHKVSPNNPCPFLRMLVAQGLLDDRVATIGDATDVIERVAATGEGSPRLPGIAIRLIALLANGLGPAILLDNGLNGVKLNQLRDGPFDKHGAGSRILDKRARVQPAELERLKDFASQKTTAGGGRELGLDAADIERMMDANYARAEGARRVIDRQIMNGEWPVLLDVMGKDGANGRYLSLREIRVLFEERRLPTRMGKRLRRRD
ncbi:MAG TPA: hypothetical protein PK399_07680 [Thermomonas sp.]|jgi:hypothetical protein|nr:hypothetical protein [Thermomonas sp.]